MKRITLKEALELSSQTRSLEIGSGVLARVTEVFQEEFGSAPAVIVADPNTFKAAGQKVLEDLRSSGRHVLDPIILHSPHLHAEQRFVDELKASLDKHNAIPVAVGSGTINDVTKYASHLLGRPYMCVATAASMDGYTAHGASITIDNVKQTVFCPAPLAVIADLDVICAAPGMLNSWGYADLLAKVPAGADWILADALGLDPIHERAWAIVQGRLRELVDDPAGVRKKDHFPTAKLVEGLMLGGFAIEAAKSTRAASGAEHLFSHTWDMKHHTHNGEVPSHGFKVGIGTLATTALYECLLARPIEKLDVDSCCASWPELDVFLASARDSLRNPDLIEVSRRECSAKYCTREELHHQLTLIKTIWPELRDKLRKQLLPVRALKQMLHHVGAPTEPEEIGLTRERLRQTYWQASFIRRRFMVLDLAIRTGLMDSCLDDIFGPGGLWPA